MSNDLQGDLHLALIEIYDIRALRRYGLSKLNQLMHAVQSGGLARVRGLPKPLVIAALLHDIGHMVHGLGEHPAAEGVDDKHEMVGAQWLSRYFGPEVCEPVRLHVEAKRYLCATESGYFQRLSSDSRESLALQGGAMTGEEARQFEKEPFWREAVTLRRIDEEAKDPDGPFPMFASFWPDIEQTLRSYPAAH